MEWNANGVMKHQHELQAILNIENIDMPYNGDTLPKSRLLDSKIIQSVNQIILPIQLVEMVLSLLETTLNISKMKNM